MREIRQLLRSLAEHGTSVLLSSHLLNEVQQICDRIAIINHGRIVAQGRVDELLNGQKPGVRVTVSDVESAVRALEALANVSVQTNGSSLTISGADSQTVMNHLLQNHIIPTEVAVQKNDLEALFMDVTSAK